LLKWEENFINQVYSGLSMFKKQQDVYEALHPTEWRDIHRVWNIIKDRRAEEGKREYAIATVWGRLDELVHAGWAQQKHAKLEEGDERYRPGTPILTQYLQVPGYKGKGKKVSEPDTDGMLPVPV
jgi:hypothetical protein